MRKLMIATAFVSIMSAPLAHADTKAPTFGASKLDPVFLTAVQQVCASSSLRLSSNAQAACATQSFPAVTTAGTAFTNRGTGAEFNALIRQLTQPATASN